MKGYGADWGKRFFADASSSIVVQQSNKPPFAVTRLVTHDVPTEVTTTPTEDSFFISVLLKPIAEGLWRHKSDGRDWVVPPMPAFYSSVFDLRATHVVGMKTPFDALHFNLPRETINTFTDDHGLARVSSIRSTISENDHALANLSRLILPFLEDEGERSELFLDHFGLLLCSRLVEGYTATTMKLEKARGGLAPWQKRKAEEILINHLGGNLKLERLARECNLSPGHFARAFKTSFGISVHRWVLDRRIEQAKALMSHSKMSLLDVAFRTGFSSQSTFTRAFQQRVGVSPGQWRRSATPMSSKAISLPGVLALRPSPYTSISSGAV